VKAPHETRCSPGCDRQIDRPVYDSYGLAEDEIAVVEGAV